MQAIPSLAIALTVGLSGCAGVPPSETSQGPGSDRLVNIPLPASRLNAGETAWATLVGRGDRTDVTIMVSGVPPQITRPIHLYSYIHGGTCGALSARPSHALTDVVLARSGGAAGQLGPPYTVANTVGARLSALREKPQAIVVRSSPADGDLLLFCGDIPGARPIG